nr:retrovirus-related Pol polyprotein from transposon TNT 1-94 [Tanacetum cinerariifolium]
MKAMLALLEASLASPQTPKTFQPNNKGLVAEIFDWDKEEVSEDEEVTQVKVLMALADDKLTVGKNHARNGKWVDITIRKVNTPLSMDEDVDWQNYLKYIIIDLKFVEEQRLNLLSKELLQAQRVLYCMICKREDHRTLDHEMYFASLKISERYKAQPYQYASTFKQILKAKVEPFPPYTHYGFNNHTPDDCRKYPECEICGSYDHSTSGHNRVIHIRGRVLAESSQSNESLIGVKCNTCGSTIHSTFDRNKFDHFKIGPKLFGGTIGDFTKELSEISYFLNQEDLQCPHGEEHHVHLEQSLQGHGFLRDKIPDISYFYVFGCHVFIHNHKDHLGKFDSKADDRYFLGYSSVSKDFRVYNTRRQKTEETYHVTFDESMESIRFTNTSVDDIGIDDSSRHPPNEFLHKDDPSR